MEANPPSSTSLKRNASAMDADDDVAASAKRVRSDEPPPPGHPNSASPMAHLSLPVTRTVEFALKRSPSSSVPLAAASENDHPPATGPTSTDGDPDAAFRAAVLAKLAEASSGSSASASAPSTASTRTGPLPPVQDHLAAIPDIEGKEDEEEGEDEDEEEETDDPDAERSDGGWDDEDEWVPPTVVRNSAGTGLDIAAEANANASGSGQSLISPPPTPVPARTDASPVPPPGPTPEAVVTAAAADTDVATAASPDVPAAATAASAVPAALEAPAPALDLPTAEPEHAPAPADVDDDWLEAVAPSNFAPPADVADDDAFWPLGPPSPAELSPLTQPTHPASPPPFSALLNPNPSNHHHTLHPGSPDSYADSGDELDQQGAQVAPGFALRGSDGAKVQCALCGRWMAPGKTAEHVARVCGTIPSPDRARKAAKRRSASTATPKTRRTALSSSSTPKQPRTPRKEKPVALPAARLAARRAELDADAWAARVDEERGVLCKACGAWFDVGGAGLGAVQRWSGRTGHKSLCGVIVESTRREEAEARMRELTHAHEAPAPVPPEILADKRVRRIDGDQAQCNVCGVWTLFKNWEAHQGGKCEQIRARREAKAARRASKTAKGLDALSDLSSDSEDDRRHPVYFVGGPGKKAKAAAEAASGSGSGTGTVATAAASAPTSAPAAAASTTATVPAPAASASSSAAVASASVSAPGPAAAPAAKGAPPGPNPSASELLRAAVANLASSATAPKKGTASSSAAKNGTASASTSAAKNGTASASASAPAPKNGKASAAAAGPASIYLPPGAPAPTKPPPGWPAGASWRPWMSDPRYGMGVIPVETMQRMYAPGGRYGPPVDKRKGKAAAAAASTSAKPSGSAPASTSAGAKAAGPSASASAGAKPAASSTGAKPSGSASGPASTSAGAKPPPVTGKRAAGPSVDAPAAKKAKVVATPESGPPKKKMLPLESIVAEADARAAAAAAASAAGPSTASGPKSAAATPAKVAKPAGSTPASVAKPVAASSAAVPPSTSKTANTAQSATPRASKPRVKQEAMKMIRAPRPFGPGKNKRVTAFSQAAKRRAASPSSSSESEKEPKPWSNAPQPYLMPANPPRVMQIRRPYQLCGLEAFVSSDPNRSTRFDDLPTDPEKLLRYERQVILHFDADVARIEQDNRIQCKGCNAWIKLPTSGVPTKKWYGRIGHKASCPGNIERQKAAAVLPAAQIPEVVFDEPFRIQRIKGSKVQCAGCSKNVSAPMWARHVEERCTVYTAATGAPKPESSDSESEAEPGPSNGKPRGRLDITIATRRAQLLEDTAVREIGEDRLLCDLCGKWVKISKHLHAGYKWYGEQGHRARCIASHPDWKPRADKDEPPSSPATSAPATPAKPGSSTPAAAAQPSVGALRSPNRGTQAPPSSPPSVIVIPDTSSDHEVHDDDAEYNPDGSGAESESSEDPELDV